MSEPEAVARLIDRALEKKDPSVTSVFVASTPFQRIFWFSLQGRYDKVLEHRSNDAKLYPLSIPVAVLAPGVIPHRSRAVVTLGMFRHLKDASTWKTWEITAAQVHQDLSTRQVAVELSVLLDGDAVAAGSFNYTVDLYLDFDA